MVTGAAPGPRCRERDRERAPAPAPVPAAGRKAAAAAAAVAGLCALCYGNALPGEFVHDDVWAIVNNPDVRAAAPVAAAFANDFWGKRMAENTSHKSYRPLCVLTFKLSFGPAFFPTGVSLSMLFRVHENKVLWLLLVS